MKAFGCQIKAWALLAGVLLCLVPSLSWGKKKAPPTKKEAAGLTIGDIAFRFDVGVETFRLSTASGETITEVITERAVRLRLNPEYGYFMSNSLALFVSLPFEFDINPTVGTTLGLELGLGFRKFFGKILYVDGRAFVRFMSDSRFVFEFGGLMLGLGAAIPLSQQLRMLVSARVPFNFIGGFRFRVQAFVGVEVLF